MALSVKNFGGGGSIGSVENLMVANLPTQTVNGITLTNNGNGTYTVNGTATADCYFYHRDVKFNGIAKLVGCPQGGATNKYYLTANVDGSWGSLDIGNGASINGNVNNVCLTVRNGTVCDNLIFKPMLTTNLKATYKEFVKRVGGFNNLFVPTAPTQTINGITFTNNGDGTYTLNGTTGSSSATLLLGKVSMEDGKQYKLTGCPKGGKIGSAFYYEIQYGYPVNGFDYGEGVICQGSSSADTRVWITVKPNTTVDGLVFKPMLTESLLPEYFDFVKGLASMDLTKLGCTKIEEGSFTPTSSVASMSVSHSLGVKPKYGIAYSSEAMSYGEKFFFMVSDRGAGVSYGTVSANDTGRGSYSTASSLGITSTNAKFTSAGTFNYYFEPGCKYNYILLA